MPLANATLETLRNVLRSSRRPGRWALLCALAVLALAAAPDATSRIVKDRAEADDDPRPVFGRIAEAWEAADVETLAGLVHRDGLRVTGGRGDRVSRYSPSQAFYYFRNVFQAHRTLLFQFDMMQDASAGERVHGMATWKRRRPDSEHIEVIKLVCTLVRDGDSWKLAELNTIR